MNVHLFSAINQISRNNNYIQYSIWLFWNIEEYSKFLITNSRTIFHGYCFFYFFLIRYCEMNPTYLIIYSSLIVQSYMTWDQQYLKIQLIQSFRTLRNSLLSRKLYFNIMYLLVNSFTDNAVYIRIFNKFHNNCIDRTHYFFTSACSLVMKILRWIIYIYVIFLTADSTL